MCEHKDYGEEISPADAGLLCFLLVSKIMIQ